jgi:4-hydroxyacetophenone monooxygenase
MTRHDTADETTAADPQLHEALQSAHMPTLLMVLVQLTGDQRWLDPRYKPQRPRGGNDPDDGGLPSDAQREIRDAAEVAVTAWRRGELQPPQLSEDQLHQMMCYSTGEHVNPDTVLMAAEEMRLADRDAGWRYTQAPHPQNDMSVVIVGAGLSGLCMAIKLEQARIPYVIIERNNTVGGTWIANVYPGAGVDSPSHLYEYSFEPYPDWPDYYSKRAEIHAYFERVCGKYGIRDKIRFSTRVKHAVWDEAQSRWQVHVEGPNGPEVLPARVFISTVGLLNRPSIPDIPGADLFRGIAMHTGDWDPCVDLSGKRIAVIGTGASAMQLVPTAAGTAARIMVFQRSPQWAIPVRDYKRPVSEQVRYLLAHVPFYAAWFRYRLFWNWNDKVHPALQIDPDWPDADRSINAANERTRIFLTNHITSTLAGRPDLIEKCLPTYPPYGKRMLMDNGWFETLLRDDVELVTEKITAITETGVATADGIEHEADIIAYATGFEAHRVLFPMDLHGRHGVRLREEWGDEDARAYLGIAIPDMPNFFCVFGPNTALGHGGSIVFHTEIQVRYIMTLLRKMLERNIRAVEVRRAVHDAYNARVDAAHDGMIWSHRGMDTWYRNSKGRVVSLSPWRLADYWHMTREADLRDYHLTLG